MEDIRQLEKKLGYRFKDRSLLKKAVTHSSYVKEHDRNGQSNERLEFLGDAFFDAVIGEGAFQKKRKASFPGQERRWCARNRWPMKRGS